ncbi:MAG: hypothetical protein F9K30_19420 [Dechloromonas sp.]|nr:MAG: hypothetical protein F9K30_19420 [Dechloromonas sp.]
MPETISKVDAARRQIDTAIDLYFDDSDALSSYTLAYAGLKVLLDIYPHHQGDGFDTQIDDLLGKEGWRHLSGIGNFLKHADRDPTGVLETFDPESAYMVLGLATLLFRRITGEFSRKMQALDYWTELNAADALGIPEMDGNPDRAAACKQIIDNMNAAPRHVRMAFARTQYQYFLANVERLEAEVEAAQQSGRPLQEILDQAFSGPLWEQFKQIKASERIKN